MVSPTIKQYWIGFGLFTDFFGHGMMMSYSYCLLPGLRATDSTIKVDLDTASWLASGLGIPMMLGFLASAILMDRFGRRWVFAFDTLLLITAWLIIYSAQNFTTLMIGRLVGGFAIASIYCSGCTIMAEYTSPELRGLFLNMKTSVLYCGYIYMHIITNYLNWRNVALLSIVPCVISFLTNLTWPESPSWLVSKNRFAESEEAFYLLRGRGEKAVKEIESIIQAQKTRMSQTQPTTSVTRKVMNFLRKLQQKNFIQPLAILFFCAILCETSGRHFFPAYALDIIMKITNDKDNSLYYVVGLDIVSLVSTLASCVFIKVMGRKTLLLFSGITSTILLIIISLVTFLISRGVEMYRGPLLVPSLLGVFFILANLGCATLPLVIYAEIFPLAHREVGAGLGGATLAMAFFVFLKILPYMLTHLQLYGTFGVFAVGTIVSLVSLYFLLPETRNRTLQEIEEYFEHGKFLDNEDRRLHDDEAKVLMFSKQPPVVRVRPSEGQTFKEDSLIREFT